MPEDLIDIRQTHADSQSAEGSRYFHRDLSWLAFNHRVLAQAADDGMPLLERVRFMSIFTSNLDEFFMKRVGLIKRQVHAGMEAPSPDGRTPRQQLSAIREEVTSLLSLQAKIWDRELVPALAKEGVAIVRDADLTTRDRAFVEEWYRAQLFPALTPLAVNPTHRFPFISNLSNNIGLLIENPTASAAERLARAARAELRKRGPSERPGNSLSNATFARVKVPSGMSAFLRLPEKNEAGGRKGSAVRFLPMGEIIRTHSTDLFPGMTILGRFGFRVTRSAGIQKDDLDTANLLQSIEADLKQRKFARVVRMEIEPDADDATQRYLMDKLNLDSQDVYERSMRIDYLALSEIADLPRPDLRHKPWKPVVPARLAVVANGKKATSGAAAASNLFSQIRKQDILVHHPYESFRDSVERFIAAAAADPDVITIKQTLYRTTPDSPFIENLMRAAEAGKQVACLVELRARFDEGRNVSFARKLERAGVHVAYGVMGYKTHCKTSLVVRKEKSGLRCYAHLGTGNYHPKTAQLYTDLGLLTSDEAITSDLVHLFNYLTGMAKEPNVDTLMVAPFSMRQKTDQLIQREIDLAKKGKSARIWAKLNALEDRDVTDRLYEASKAGVQVHLIVRGFCCLVPGVKGLSENIRVSSVVGRFLEHSRVYHFGGGSEDPADGDWYISSADWMYRNLSNRVEVGCPLRDKEARARVARMFEVHELDHRNAWELRSDGMYVRRALKPAEAAKLPATSPQRLGTFESLMREAQG
jgi:polyphosphate kinase